MSGRECNPAFLFEASQPGDEVEEFVFRHRLIEAHGHESPVNLEDVLACCGEAGAQTLDRLVYNVTGSKPEALLTSFQLLMQEGVPLIVVLRSLQNHFRRLHFVTVRTEPGEVLEIVMKSLQPPVFWKQEDMFKAQLRTWTLPGLARTLQKLADQEASLKKPVCRMRH